MARRPVDPPVEAPPAKRPRRMHPNSLANLRRKWQPGESGRSHAKGPIPSGPNPRRVRFEVLLERILDEQIDDPLVRAKYGDLTRRELIARVFVEQIVRRDPVAMREYLKRAFPAISEVDMKATLSTDDDELRDAILRKLGA